MPSRMPMWQLRLWPSRKESDFDTVFWRFKTASSHPAKRLVFNFDFLKWLDLRWCNWKFRIQNQWRHRSLSVLLCEIERWSFYIWRFRFKQQYTKTGKLNLKLISPFLSYSDLENCWMWTQTDWRSLLWFYRWSVWHIQLSRTTYPSLFSIF